jgi:UDP-N-acetylglucosamine--N-acetylmuramyl-(pentapeptide) pyrophosphoryl-undecaprenol N-acetylglucosamine transferase
MNMNSKPIERAIISGGGTGGHIFPAIAIADEIRRRNPNAEILFVGAIGKMEMEKVPQAGYKIVGLKIVGFQRRLSFSNFLLPFRIFGSLIRAYRIVRDFKPQVVIGVGGYASGPTLQVAHFLKIPTLLQEQNSFPGKTNKILARKASVICTAYEGLERFFPAQKIRFTGNPIRLDMVDIRDKREEAFQFYGLDPLKKTILVMGGSLGARTINDSVAYYLTELQQRNIQVLWQCGKFYFDTLNEEYGEKLKGIKILQFITQMDLAYALADVIISRAGAISISELCIVGKSLILVPSPNVAEDHQTKNAMALVSQDAALLVTDIESQGSLMPVAIELLHKEEELQRLSSAIQKLGKPGATSVIVDELEKVA